MDRSSKTLRNHGKVKWPNALAACAIATCIAGTVWLGPSSTSRPTGGQFPDVAAVSSSHPTGNAAPFAVSVRRPTGPPVIELEDSDPLGRTSVVGCTTCHSVRAPDFANRAPADLDQFHQGMQFSHGALACFSCHHPHDYDALRLADGTVVEYSNVMDLCAQCHGPQATGYAHGAHGGMNGYWDLTRGPRTRNNCIDCHDPHVPKFPSMHTTFKPRDRFLEHSLPRGASNSHESH